MEQAPDTIYLQCSQGFQHDYQASYQVLDVHMSGLPCGPKATTYQEVVVDRLFDGKTQLTRALQPLLLAAEETLQLDEDKRRRTLVRLDAGGRSLDDVNWLLARGYLVRCKDYSGQQAKRLATSVTDWYVDPHLPERQFGWVTEAADAYVRPIKRIAARCRKPDGEFAYGVLISALSAQHALFLTGQPLSLLEDPAAALLAYVTFYDQRGGGIETSFKGDKQGLGMTTRNKKRFAAQQMVILLGSLAHNMIVWARRWLASPTLQRYGMLCMVHNALHISGFLLTDAFGQMTQVVLNQAAPLAPALVHPLRQLLASAHVAVNLGQT